VFGRQEAFNAGILSPPSDRKLWWFRFGKTPLFHDLSDQRDLVDDATGVSVELDSSISATRQTNYLAFCRKQCDNGFSEQQIPLLAYQYHQKLQCIFTTPVKETFVYGGGDRVSRRAFDTAELEAFEDFLRLAIAASNKGGGLRLENGILTIKQSTNRSGSINPSALTTHIQSRSLTPPPGRRLTLSSTDSAQSSSRKQKRTSLPNNSKATFSRSTGFSNSNAIPDALRLVAVGEFIIEWCIIC
jgi:hypothetical protein